MTKTLQQKEEDKAIVQFKGESVVITLDDIKTLICPLATDQEAIIFLKTCQSLQLSPFADEIFLIKYDTKEKAAMVVAIDAYLKAAEVNEHYDGCEAGVILANSAGTLEFREGAFLLEGERGMLVGGWARVYRTDRGRPTYTAVNKTECIKLTKEGKPTKFWAVPKQPWMLRKTALKRGLVEAFPSLFAGTLASAEVGGEIEAEYREIPEGTLPPALEKKGKPNWRKFWVKVKDELDLTQEQAHELLRVKSIKNELIDTGWTMEQMWNALVNVVQTQQKVTPPGTTEPLVDQETGEVITPERTILEQEEADRILESELFDEKEPSTEPEEGNTAKLKRDPESIKTLNDLTRACFDDFNMQPSDVWKELGYGSAREITKLPSVCYREIAAPRGKED